MDIPITLRFFEKLNLYQNVRKLDRVNGRDWDCQRRALCWAADPMRHRHRSTKLTVQHAFDNSDITGIGTEEADAKDRIRHECFGNLVSRGFATWSDERNRDDGVYFTRDGFLVGEVINEIQKNPGTRFRYSFFYCLSWAIFVAGAVIVFGEASKTLYDLFEFAKSQLGFLRH